MLVIHTRKMYKRSKEWGPNVTAEHLYKTQPRGDQPCRKQVRSMGRRLGKVLLCPLNPLFEEQINERTGRDYELRGTLSFSFYGVEGTVRYLADLNGPISLIQIQLGEDEHYFLPSNRSLDGCAELWRA